MSAKAKPNHARWRPRNVNPKKPGIYECAVRFTSAIRGLLARVERLEPTVQELGLRNADLEADAERYRWLRDNADVGQGEHVYEQMAYQFEVLTGVSHVSHIYHYAKLPSIDAAIDAARNAK